MKERPILFSGEMVRAILDGQKTQTRRIVKPQPFWIAGNGDPNDMGGYQPGTPVKESTNEKAYGEFEPIRSPYGVPGDRLWVRETHLLCKNGGPAPLSTATYACFRDGAQQFRNGKSYCGTSQLGPLNWPSWAKWRPSIHMPRWASRITLEITGVRVERVKSITWQDAVAEGAAVSQGATIKSEKHGGYMDAAVFTSPISGTPSTAPTHGPRIRGCG